MVARRNTADLLTDLVRMDQLANRRPVLSPRAQKSGRHLDFAEITLPGRSPNSEDSSWRPCATTGSSCAKVVAMSKVPPLPGLVDTVEFVPTLQAPTHSPDDAGFRSGAAQPAMPSEPVIDITTDQTKLLFGSEARASKRTAAASPRPAPSSNEPISSAPATAQPPVIQPQYGAAVQPNVLDHMGDWFDRTRPLLIWKRFLIPTSLLLVALFLFMFRMPIDDRGEVRSLGEASGSTRSSGQAQGVSQADGRPSDAMRASSSSPSDDNTSEDLGSPADGDLTGQQAKRRGTPGLKSIVAVDTTQPDQDDPIVLSEQTTTARRSPESNRTNPTTLGDDDESPAKVFYLNCSLASAAGAAPMSVSDPGYRSGLDADNDGIACEQTVGADRVDPETTTSTTTASSSTQSTAGQTSSTATTSGSTTSQPSTTAATSSTTTSFPITIFPATTAAPTTSPTTSTTAASTTIPTTATSTSTTLTTSSSTTTAAPTTSLVTTTTVTTTTSSSSSSTSQATSTVATDPTTTSTIESTTTTASATTATSDSSSGNNGNGKGRGRGNKGDPKDDGPF